MIADQILGENGIDHETACFDVPWPIEGDHSRDMPGQSKLVDP